MKFIAASGAVLITFLAGAELEPSVMRTKIKEVSVVGLIGFFAPFLGCAALARYILGWSPQESLLAGVALSTTSMAVVYAVMLESGFNKTGFARYGIYPAAMSESIWEWKSGGFYAQGAEK